jgi:hypothetical protein
MLFFYRSGTSTPLGGSRWIRSVVGGGVALSESFLDTQRLMND